MPAPAPRRSAQPGTGLRVMLLAAGRGERMRPLTDTCPKPLLRAGGRPLIEWHLLALARAGFAEVVINHAWLGECIEAALGDGRRWGLRIRYSPEPEALETAGGIAHALPLLGPGPVAAIAADIRTDFDYRRLPALAQRMRADRLHAWCVLVPNPPHHPDGDFALRQERLHNDGQPRYTFSGIGVYDPCLFSGLGQTSEPGSAGPAGAGRSPCVPTRSIPGHPPRAALAPLLRAAAETGLAGGECHHGLWVDVGTPERLAWLEAQSGIHQTGLAGKA